MVPRAVFPLLRGALFLLLPVPQELAYGSRGKGLKIPPYSTLRFEIELISSESVGQSSTPTRKPVTSNVVRIPSSSELKQGAKPEVLSKDQIEKLKKEKIGNAHM